MFLLSLARGQHSLPPDDSMPCKCRPPSSFLRSNRSDFVLKLYFLYRYLYSYLLMRQIQDSGSLTDINSLDYPL